MRNIAVVCLCAGLSFQAGCAWFPKSPKLFSQSSESKSAKGVHDKATSKFAEEYVAARQLETDGKYEEARERYEGMLKRSPNNPDYLHRMGVVCTHLQRFGEATNFYERAQKLDPKNPRLLADMGYSAYLKGDMISAEKLLREAHAKKPSDQRTTNNLALVIGMKGKTDESMELLKKSGDEASALASMAYIRFKRGETDQARQLYAEALELNPDLKEAKQALARLGKPTLDQHIAADIEPVKTKAVRTASRSAAVKKDDEIKLIADSDDFSPKKLTTAAYETESSEADLHEEFSSKVEPASDDAFADSPVDPFEEESIHTEDFTAVTSKKSKSKTVVTADVSESESDENPPATTRYSRKTNPLMKASFELVDDDEVAASNLKSETRSASLDDLEDDLAATMSEPMPKSMTLEESPKSSKSKLNFDDSDLE